MRLIVSLICGLMMSAGLILSGMVNPQKVLGFLDILGHFDPTLAFVMAGALTITVLGFQLAGRCSKPFLCDGFSTPTKTKLDAPLLAGSALFGVGWGLAGFCPGPAIVSLGLAVPQAVLLVGAMITGMVLARRLQS